MNLYIVIAVFNRKQITLRCLEQLHAQTFKDFKVIVVDDGSTDGTSTSIQQLYPETILLKGEGDWWWTKSVNQGIKKALEQNASHILLLNDDTHFDNHYIRKVHDHINQYPESIVGSLNLTSETPHKIYFSGVKSFKRLSFKYVRYQPTLQIYNPHSYHEKMYKTVYLPGRGLLVPSTAFQKIGLLDEINFPQYLSDIDFTLKAYENKVSMYISHDLVLHTPLNSTGSGDIYKAEPFSKFLKSFSNKYSKRHLKTSFRFVRKHVPLLFLPVSFFFYQSRIFGRYFIYHLKSAAK